MKPSLILTSAVVAALGAGTQAATLKFECNASSTDGPFCTYVQQRFAEETGHQLEFVELPSSSTEKLGLFQQLFASGQSDVVDVFQADVVWPGILSEHMLDLSDTLGDRQADFFDAPWQNNIIDGELKAVPGFIDTGVLYYRSDLLEKYNEPVPTTWAEMTSIAETIQAGEREAGHDGFWGLVFQGKAYEGLTCDALEWVASYNGGTVVDADGTITINNEGAAAGLDMAASWIGNIAPQGVLGYQEEEARAVFQNGDALFMRNWPYAYLLAQDEGSPIKGQVGIAPLPKGTDDGRHAATLGGWQWAVSRYTEHPEAAKALVALLSDTETQIQRFLLTGVSPANKQAYEDPRVIEQAPHMAQLLEVFEASVARPATATGDKYARVSNAFYNVAFSVLNGDQSGAEGVAELEARLARIKRNAW